MVKRDQLRPLIGNVYKQRMQSITINNQTDFLELLNGNERDLYFYLMYAYLYDLDLTNILDFNITPVRIVISLFCDNADKLGYPEIRKYYDKFLVTNESTQQAGNVIKELTMVLKKKEIKEQYNL